MTSTSPNPQTLSRKNGSAPLIRLDAVTKVFLTDEVETHALSGIHLDIRDGEYISIAGPSGCGKSTLLSILGLLDTPSNGSYARSRRQTGDPARGRTDGKPRLAQWRSGDEFAQGTARRRRDHLHGHAR